MANTLSHSPADIVRQTLIDLGLGSDPSTVDADGNPTGSWPVYASGEPNKPDEVITVYDEAGITQGRTMVDGELQGNNGFQVRIRSATHAAGWLKADAVRRGMAQSVRLMVVDLGDSSYEVGAIVGIGFVLVLGKETPSSKRSLFTVNALLVVRQIS